MIRSYSTLLFWLGMIIANSVALYHTSDRVTALDRQLRTVNAEIADEKESLHVLRAEWVYLSNPARIEKEAKRFLPLGQTAPKRVAGLSSMNDVVPGVGASDIPAMQVADATPSPAPQPKVGATRRDRAVAALNAGRVNDHIKIEHAAATTVTPDRIGALISSLSFTP